MLFILGPLFVFCVSLRFFVFCLLVDLIRLSVPMQVIGKTRVPSDLQCVDGNVKP